MTHREMCPHLAELERDLRRAGFAIEAEGASWWSKPARGKWIYFACTLPEELGAQYELPSFVRYSAWDGRVAGHEAGFYCDECESAVVGGHPAYRLPLASLGRH